MKINRFVNQVPGMEGLFSRQFTMGFAGGIMRNKVIVSSIRKTDITKQAQTEYLNCNKNTQIFMQYPIDRAHVQYSKDNE